MGPRLDTSILTRFEQVLPVRAWTGAQFDFAARFNRNLARLHARGGAGVSPSTARIAYGPALRIRIDPTRVTRRLGSQVFVGASARRTDAAFIDAHDWSSVLHPLTDSVVHGEIIALCRRHGDVRAFGRYQRLAARIDAGEVISRSGFVLDSHAALDDYFAYYRALVDGIAQRGVIRRDEFARRVRLRRAPWRDWVERDIGVAVSADGELVHHGPGRHRLAAALGLGLTDIPVEVRLVHADWLVEQGRIYALPPFATLSLALAALSRA